MKLKSSADDMASLQKLSPIIYYKGKKINVKDLLKNISEAELVTVSYCGHMSTMEQPERVSRIMHHWLTQK